jgi:hypothetical protein
MVHKLRSTTRVRHPRSRVAGKLAVASIVLLCLTVGGLAQEPAVHYWHQSVMPPGAIGSRQLQRGGPLAGYFQPVEIKAPPGVSISLAVANQLLPPKEAPQRVGLLIGSVYRLRVTNIPRAEGVEVFPTIEVIDRTYAPNGHEVRFAIPIEIVQQDLELAIEGKFVTRIIYLEDPHNALPVRQTFQSDNASGQVGKPEAQNSGGQQWFEVAPGHDPLAAADELGRPVAILRMGGRVPNAGPDPNFYYGSPAWVYYPPRTALEAKPVRESPPPRPAAAPAEQK